MIFNDLKNGRFYNEDCFDAMREIPDDVINMILCDLPYGTTQNKWDSILPLDKLWIEYWRVCKSNAAIVLTAAQPFTTILISSQIENFKFACVWDTVNKYSNYLNAKKQPMRRHEDICIFSKGKITYNPIMEELEVPYITRKTISPKSDNYGETNIPDVGRERTHKSPCSIIQIKGRMTSDILHPTQKPVALFEYLIKTYTNENELVLDNTAGSGTTAIAAINTNRKWVCIEKDKEYYDKAIKRINNHGPTTQS